MYRCKKNKKINPWKLDVELWGGGRGSAYVFEEQQYYNLKRAKIIDIVSCAIKRLNDCTQNIYNMNTALNWGLTFTH